MADQISAMFPGELASGVVVFGHEINVTFRWVVSEVDRRQRCGLQAITAVPALRSLFALPEGVPVPATSIDPFERVILGELPPGAVDEIGTDLIRRAVPPVQLTGIIKEVRTWADAQDLVLLRTHAPRLALAPPELARRIAASCDPELGVVAREADDMKLERSPGRRWVKPSWQRWLVAEMVALAARDAQPTTSSQA